VRGAKKQTNEDAQIFLDFFDIKKVWLDIKLELA
jgi:hypothetical protein